VCSTYLDWFFGQLLDDLWQHRSEKGLQLRGKIFATLLSHIPKSTPYSLWGVRLFVVALECSFASGLAGVMSLLMRRCVLLWLLTAGGWWLKKPCFVRQSYQFRNFI